MPTLRLTGVNIAGLEFNPAQNPGHLDVDYVAPDLREIAYYRDAGASVIRVPFLWERLQPRLGGHFDAAYLALLQSAVQRAAGMHVILDAHQFGRRWVNGEAQIIGESAVSADQFASFWATLATHFMNDNAVIFGLQNEPHDQNTDQLVTLQNRAIAAIRDIGGLNLILVTGNAWSGAHSWSSSGNADAMLQVQDRADNIAFEVHQYLDNASSGAQPGCAPGASARLAGFSRWCRDHGRRGFLGEFGAGADAQCQNELSDLLQHIADNPDVWIGWTYWAGGAWWPSDYPLSVKPLSLDRPMDRPQMATLRRYFQ
jgi:endoglucanase